jgi:myo-inositol-1(or 4)-monophosphatase
VTEADIAVNEFLHTRLSELVRDAGWKSEDQTPPCPTVPSRLRGSSIDRWHPRLYFGSADWSISVALAEHGRPLIASIYAPVSDEMFSLCATGVPC